MEKKKEITSFRAVRSPMNLLLVERLSELWIFLIDSDQHACGIGCFDTTFIVKGHWEWISFYYASYQHCLVIFICCTFVCPSSESHFSVISLACWHRPLVWQKEHYQSEHNNKEQITKGEIVVIATFLHFIPKGPGLKRFPWPTSQTHVVE